MTEPNDHPGDGDNERASTIAPVGDLATFSRAPFQHGPWTHDIYRKGHGPSVIVITEMPGMSPMVLGFADRLVAMGLSVALPNLFGEAGRDPLAGSGLSNALYGVRSIGGACISREFTTMALGRSSAVIDCLRELARVEHERCGGPGVGVVGMCFTGGFALAMATDPRVARAGAVATVVAVLHRQEAQPQHRHQSCRPGHGQVSLRQRRLEGARPALQG